MCPVTEDVQWRHSPWNGFFSSTSSLNENIVLSTSSCVYFFPWTFLCLCFISVSFCVCFIMFFSLFCFILLFLDISIFYRLFFWVCSASFVYSPLVFLLSNLFLSPVLLSCIFYAFYFTVWKKKSNSTSSLSSLPLIHSILPYFPSLSILPTIYLPFSIIFFLSLLRSIILPLTSLPFLPPSFFTSSFTRTFLTLSSD